MKEQYFNIPLDTMPQINDGKLYVLVIYDISDTKKRNKLFKLLNSFGYRIQYSAFEAILSPAKIEKMKKGIERIVDVDDNVRIYKIRGKGAVTIFGKGELITSEDVVFI